MANTNGTSVLSQAAVIKSTPTQHFSIIYHDTLSLLLRTHSTVFRTYMALQTLPDASKVTENLVQEIKSVGFSGADYGTTEQEILAALQKLREMGFIWVLPRDGRPDEIYLMPFLNDQQKAKFQGRTNELPPPSAPAEQIKREIDEAPWENGNEDQPLPQVAQQSSRRRSQASSSSEQLPSTPALSPWWSKHQDHLKFLNEIWKNYPKKANVKYAMEAWEALFSTGDELSPDEQKEIWNGLQWWYAYWIENNTEEKFIPNLSRFIEREQWLPEVIQERQQKDAARNRR